MFMQRPILTIEALQAHRFNLNGFMFHQLFQDSLIYSDILEVNGMEHCITKTIVTIAI